MAKRPSLTDMAQRKPSEASVAPAAASADNAGDVSGKRAGAQPDGRKGILVRVAPEGWKQLRDLAADLTISSGEQVTMQSLILDAINDVLRSNGRPPLA